MTNPWEQTKCDEVAAYYTHYPVLEAAMLWCGVPADRLLEIKSQCLQGSPGIWKHPNIACIEPKCRAMHQAIQDGVLACGRDGVKVAPHDYVRPDRRTIAREALKGWIASAFPASKPAFLFDEVERRVHEAITVEAYKAVEADRDRLQLEVNALRKTPRADNADSDRKLQLITALIEGAGLPIQTASGAELARRAALAGYPVSADICERLLKQLRERIPYWKD